MEKLILERSPAEQGKPVKVYVSGSRGHCGVFIVTFEEWLHFNKLIREGSEHLKRKNEQRIEIVIRGIGEKEPKKKAEEVEVKPKPSTEKLDAEVDEIMAGIVKPVETIVEAHQAIEVRNESLVRSLIREGDKNAGD